MSEPIIPSPVYAIGPMTGRDGHNFSWWAEVAEWCKARGYHLLDARKHGGGDMTLERPRYMSDSINDVLSAQSIILHSAWTTSAGAFLEWHAAYELALPVYLWPARGMTYVVNPAGLVSTELLPEWPRADQDHVARLVRQSLAAIVESRSAGRGKHGVDSYTTEPRLHHITLAAGHAQKAKDIARGDRLDDGEDHMARVLCRAAMAMEVRAK